MSVALGLKICFCYQEEEPCLGALQKGNKRLKKKANIVYIERKQQQSQERQNNKKNNKNKEANQLKTKAPPTQ